MRITSKIGTNDVTLGTVTSPSKISTFTSQLLTSLPGAPENSSGSVKALANCPLSRQIAGSTDPPSVLPCWKWQAVPAPGVLAWSCAITCHSGFARLQPGEEQIASRRPCIWLCRANEQRWTEQWLPTEQMCLKSASVHLVTSWNQRKIYMANYRLLP